MQGNYCKTTQDQSFINNHSNHFMMENESYASSFCTLETLMPKEPPSLALMTMECYPISISPPCKASMTTIEPGASWMLQRMSCRSSSRQKLSSEPSSASFLSWWVRSMISSSMRRVCWRQRSMEWSRSMTSLADSRFMVPPIHFILFLWIFWIQPIPSSTLVISYMRLFCTPSSRVASLMSSTKFSLLLIRCMNRLVRIESEFSLLHFSPSS